MRKTGPTPNIRNTVINRAGGLCEVCDQNGEQIHHRKPRSMGGSKDPAINSPANLVLLCSRCHLWVETKGREAAYDRHLLLRHIEDAAQTPVKLKRGWSTLTDDGRYE